MNLIFIISHDYHPIIKYWFIINSQIYRHCRDAMINDLINHISQWTRFWPRQR